MSNVTNFFGEHLSKMTEKPTRSCNGLIRLAVLDKFPGKTPEQINFNELKDVFNTTFGLPWDVSSASPGTTAAKTTSAEINDVFIFSPHLVDSHPDRTIYKFAHILASATAIARSRMPVSS